MHIHSRFARRQQSADAEVRLRRWAIGAALVAAILRLVHLAISVNGPLVWQPGPDEAHYLAFGRDVAFGSGGLDARFAFMDPAYGYLIGAVLWLAGSVFPLYLLQIAADVAAGYGLYRIGARLGAPQAGIVATFLYALLGPAIAYSVAILKPTWVSAFTVAWLLLALRADAGARARDWLALGVWSGIGIALRSNLLLLPVLGLPVLAWLVLRRRMSPSRVMRHAGIALLGFLLPVALLAARNHAIDGHVSPFPTNGGVVLHQLYNPDNPESRGGVPSFVGRYSTPDRIWQAYRDEAARRLGRMPDPHETSRYWRDQALAWIAGHPGRVVRNALRKLAEFTAWPEVPNTRSYADERLASPLLAWFPPPFLLLFALGVPGLVLLVRADRRAVLVLVPLAAGLVTVALFFAEDRFRFNAIAPFVLGTGAALVALRDAVAGRDLRTLAMLAASALVLAAWSAWQAHVLIRDYPHDWQRLAWGYLKGGRTEQALAIARQAEAIEPDAEWMPAFRGFLALGAGEHAIAEAELRRAVELRPDQPENWHNHATALAALSRFAAAAQAERRAWQLSGDAGYALQSGEWFAAAGEREAAAEMFRAVIATPGAARWHEAARRGLEHVGR